MGHANIVDNRLQDDNAKEIEDLPFADPTPGTFRQQIDLFESQRCQVPTGWHHLYTDTVRMLRAVDCPQRDGIELSAPLLVRGALLVQIYNALSDKVVHGIINKLAKRTDCTCELCGRGTGAVYRLRSGQTLCAGCHVKTDLEEELDLWLGSKYKNQLHRERPIVEFASLPINIQLLIPRHKRSTLRLAAPACEISYVQPSTVLAQSKLFRAMQQYLDLIKLVP